MEDHAQGIIRSILLCIDGEAGTERAVRYAIEITRALGGRLTVLHVINSYLEKFADEIYAVGRSEYCDHMDRELRKEAEDILGAFRAREDLFGISYCVKVRCGNPEEEILEEIRENPYDLLVLGAKPMETLQAKMRSFNLPKKIFSALKIPTLFVQ